jgi:hypothetical protein
MTMIAVLYDTRTRKLLGRKGHWMSAEEFEKHPPEKPEDMIPESAAPPEPDPDPGPTYKCINHQLYVCSGTTCFRLGVSC